MAWTTPFTWTFKFVPTFAFLNQQIRDNFNLLATYIDTTTGRWAGLIKKWSETVTALTITANTLTVDLSQSNAFSASLTANITTFTVSNWTAGSATPVTIRLTQDATGGRTVAFPAGWRWSAGIVPTVTPTANKTDILSLYSDDGGTTIYPSLYTANA